jgi:dynein heavy chain
LISLYLNTLDVKRKEYNANKNRLSSGLTKLNLTNDSIANLKISLAEMQPILEEKNDQLKLTLDQVQQDKMEADVKEAIVLEEKDEVEKTASEAKAIADEAEHDMRVAQPELDKAKIAVAKLEKNDIVELKSFTTPPEAV